MGEWKEYAGIHTAASERDVPTYPENGVIYEGDYYDALPFGQYIRRQSVADIKQERKLPVFDILEYGAVPDAYVLSTDAFQRAADAAHAAGGGIVYVHGGHYCMGTVKIYSNTVLFIEMDAAIVASRNVKKHQDAFLIFEDAENVWLTGGGKVICSGEYFVHLPLRRPLLHPLAVTKVPPVLFDKMGYPHDTIRYAYRSRIRYAGDAYGDGADQIQRPMYSVWAHHCRNLHISNIIIRDAMDWSLCIDHCERVLVEDTVIDDNRHVANTDGIDIMGSEDVEIRHCFVSSADDGICIKAPRTHVHDDLDIADTEMEMRGCKRIYVRDCTVVSVMNAFKIGTETYYDIEDVTVENCHFMLPDIYPGSVSGINIASSDGSVIRNIHVKGIRMEKVVCPLFINLNMRNKFGLETDAEKSAEDGKDAVSTAGQGEGISASANQGEAQTASGKNGRGDRRFGGVVENIVIEDICAEDAELPSLITGFAAEEEGAAIERRVKNIQISGFHVQYRDNQESLSPQKSVAENVRDYPESNAFGDLPAYGIYVRHADNVTLCDVQITPRSCNQRPCIVFEEGTVSGSSLERA